MFSSAKMIAVVVLVLASLNEIHSAPLARCMVDMTYKFDNDTLHWPEAKGITVNVVLNGTMEELGGLWVQSEEYASSTHVGTHMDAPAHFALGGITIEQIPVSQLIAPAAVVDITDKAESDPDYEVTVGDLTHWEGVTGQSLDGTVLLIRSGWGKKWGDRTAFFGTPENDVTKLRFPGMSEEACQWLVDNRRVNGVGTETLSFDKGATTTFPCHKILLGRGLFGLENVANMDQIPIYGAKLYVMPMKIAGASGAPTRIVATYPEVIFRESKVEGPPANEVPDV